MVRLIVTGLAVVVNVRLAVAVAAGANALDPSALYGKVSAIPSWPVTVAFVTEVISTFGFIKYAADLFFAENETVSVPVPLAVVALMSKSAGACVIVSFDSAVSYVSTASR